MTGIPGLPAVSGVLARLRSLGRGLIRRDDVESEMDEEFHHHLTLRTEDLMREGLSPKEAARRARVEFGHVETHKEAARASRGLRWFDRIRFSWLDVKLGLRMLARHPGLTVVGGLAMAFGIAIGAGTFQFVKDLAFPNLPYSEGERIVRIQNVSTKTTRPDPRALHDFVAWREELRSVEDVGAFYVLARNLSLGKAAAPVRGVAISAVAFDLVSVRPLLGRSLVPADEATGAPAVAVIGYELWQERFGGDPDVVGRVVRLGDEPTTVVGVMPEDFAFPTSQGLWVPEFWIPFRLDPLAYERGTGPGITVLGRLAPGASLDDAQAELTTLGARMADRWPATHGHLTPRVSAFPPSAIAAPGDLLTVGGVLTLSALFLAALMVVLCANVALLLFARAAAREGEMAVRSALGASRARIVGQLFAEALVLGGVATLVGLVGATMGLRWVLHDLESPGEPLPFWIHRTLSPTTVGYAVVLALVGSAVAGVLPGLKVTGRRAHASLQRLAGRGSGALMGRVWSGIIVTQVALSVMFVGVVVRVGLETWELRTTVQGLPTAEHLSARLAMDRSDALPFATDATTDDDFIARFEEAYRALERRLAAEPGVEGVTVATQLPGLWHRRRPVEVDAPDVSSPAVWGGRAQFVSVDPDFFDIMGAPILSGRDFDAADLATDRRVVIVNESFVREFLDGRNAVGRRVRYPQPGAGGESASPEGPAPWYEIVGVVQDLVMTLDAGLPHDAGIYHPLVPGETYPVRMAVHVAGEPEAFIGRLRQLATDVDPTLRLHGPRALDQAARDTLVSYDVWFFGIALAGMLALLLTNAGIYAVISFTVSRRTREIGVRVALGADRRQVVAAILSRTARQVGVGVLIGTGLLLLFTFALYGGSLRPTLRGGGLLLAYTAGMMGVCMLGCVVPTRRALRIEPTEALAADG